MSARPIHLVWFRHDLRYHDNQALDTALQRAQHDNGSVVGLYIATPVSWQAHDMAPIRQHLLRRRVQALSSELAQFNIPLLALEGTDYADCSDIIAQLLPLGITALYAQQEYELREQVRDKQVTRLLAQHQVTAYWFERLCVMPPASVRNKQGEVYKVFTPFKRSWLSLLTEKSVFCYSKPRVQLAPTVHFPALPPLLLSTPELANENSQNWPVDELAILQRMRQFCQQRVQDYALQRDFPALDGTSTLSPYLAIGALSAQQCVARLQLEAGEQLYQEQSGAAIWLSELIWRDFYKHILVAFPKLIKHRAFQDETDLIVWPGKETRFAAWCRGETGYPIVDAAMRQLNQTGWMHNRLRMIVASFLVKDLHIDWRLGEQYFMSKLIDGDFAANNGGWQWAASTGTDAVPYFRIFNPVTQSQRFDPKGVFIRQYIPELAAIADKEIHWPHKTATPVGYFKPIVEHDVARKITLELFTAAKEQQRDMKPEFDKQ